MVTRELRFDLTTAIAGVKRTPQGGLDIPANLTRTGVFLYMQPDGTVRREYRPPSEVFNEDSLVTLRGAPATIGHPGLVNPDTWGNVTVGHVADDVKASGRFVDSRVRVQRGDALKKVESKELVELSCGYVCDMDPTPGVTPQGEKYDAVQRNIRYNHVALLPRGGGRAGEDVKLRMDGTDITGSAYAIDMELADALKEIEKLQGQLAAATARADAADAAAKQATELDIDALVQDRLNLVQDAQVVLGTDYDASGKKRSEVLGETVAKAYPNLKLDGKSEEYLEGLFLGAVDAARKGQTNVARTNVRVDATEVTQDAINDARKRNEERSRNAWKGDKR